MSDFYVFPAIVFIIAKDFIEIINTYRESEVTANVPKNN